MSCCVHAFLFPTTNLTPRVLSCLVVERNLLRKKDEGKRLLNRALSGGGNFGVEDGRRVVAGCWVLLAGEEDVLWDPAIYYSIY